MKRKLLDNGNIWQKSDGRWIGMVRYKDEYGVTQRKSFSSKKKKTLQAKQMPQLRKPLKQIPAWQTHQLPLKQPRALQQQLQEEVRSVTLPVQKSGKQLIQSASVTASV